MLLLIVLITCHYLADYQFTSRRMISAKADAVNLLPILEHAAVHAVMMFVVLLLWAVSWKISIVCFVVEMSTHFFIDVAKSKASVRFPILKSPTNKAYWQVYGFDQFLHTIVILVMYFIAVKNLIV